MSPSANQETPRNLPDRNACKVKKLSPTEIVEKLIDIIGPSTDDRWSELMRMAVSWHRQGYDPEQLIFPVVQEFAESRAGELPKDLRVLSLAIEDFRQRTTFATHQQETGLDADTAGAGQSERSPKFERSGCQGHHPYRGPRSIRSVIHRISKERKK